MKSELNKGETVSVKSFAFTNKQGGTGMSDWEFNKRFKGVAQVKITKRWDDYECGERAIAQAVSDNLKRYLDSEAGSDRRVFISEFDLTETQPDAPLRDNLVIALDALRHIKQQADAECINCVALSQQCERAITQAGGRV